MPAIQLNFLNNGGDTLEICYLGVFKKIVKVMDQSEAPQN